MKGPIYRHSDFDYLETVHSLWRDMDSLGHINHGAYLTYMETVRLNHRSHLGMGQSRRESEVAFILASLKVDYLSQARHPSAFEVGLRVSRVGTKSFDTLMAVFKADQDTPLVQGTFTLVAYSYIEEKTLPVPETIIKACRPL